MGMMLRCYVGGAYQVRVLDAEGHVRLETDWFDNMVVDSGLDWLGNTSGIGDAFVTNGTTPPSPSDTTLSGTILGYSNSIALSQWEAQISTLPNYVRRRHTYTYGYGAIVGTISEVAIGTGSLSGLTRLFSRALIANSGGTPITITLTAADQLQLVYEYRHYIPDDDTTFNLTVNGADTTFTVRPREIDSSIYWAANRLNSASFFAQSTPFLAYNSPSVLGARTASPTGADYESHTNGAMLTYVNGTFSRDFYVEWLPAKGELNVTAFALYGYNSIAGSWQIGVSPAIVKTDLQTLRVEGTVSWGRYGESS